LWSDSAAFSASWPKQTTEKNSGSPSCQVPSSAWVRWLTATLNRHQGRPAAE
jgi:hypothetical protein